MLVDHESGTDNRNRIQAILNKWGFFLSKRKMEAIDMLVDHESGTDNLFDVVKDR